VGEVHYAVYRVTDARRPAPALLGIEDLNKTTDQADVRWLKFGDRYFVYGPNGSRALAPPVGLTLETARNVEHVGNDSLCLVTQKGRRFQDEHPEIPVLFNRGRYLLVVMSGPLAEQIGASREPNYVVTAVCGGETVYDLCPPPSPRPVPDPAIQALVDRMSRLSVRANTITLASYLTRNSLTRRFREAARWAAETLIEMDYNVTLSEFGVPLTRRSPAGRSLNVVAEKQGTRTGDRALMLVVAHLDSVNWQAPIDKQIAAPAPGADDNASGIAGLIEMARLFSSVAIADDLRFVLFGGEEQGLFGSKSYVRRLPMKDRERIVVALNMDMIAKVRRRPYTVLLEGAPVSKVFVEGLCRAAHAYASLDVLTSLNPHDSDHVSFLEQGIPAVLTIEGCDEEEHSSADTLDLLDYELALQILRMNTAFVAEKVGIAGVASNRGHTQQAANGGSNGGR
jgi:Peptidase family M28